MNSKIKSKYSILNKYNLFFVIYLFSMFIVILLNGLLANNKFSISYFSFIFSIIQIFLFYLFVLNKKAEFRIKIIFVFISFLLIFIINIRIYFDNIICIFINIIPILIFIIIYLFFHFKKVYSQKIIKTLFIVNIVFFIFNSFNKSFRYDLYLTFMNNFMVLFFIYTDQNEKVSYSFLYSNEKLRFKNNKCILASPILFLLILIEKTISSYIKTKTFAFFDFPNLLYLSIFPAVIEEFVFRYFYFQIFPLSENKRVKNIILISLNGLIFYIIHSKYSYSISFNSLRFLALSLILPFLYYQWKSIKVNTIAHSLYNFISALLIG